MQSVVFELLTYTITNPYCSGIHLQRNDIGLRWHMVRADAYMASSLVPLPMVRSELLPTSQERLVTQDCIQISSHRASKIHADSCHVSFSASNQ